MKRSKIIKQITTGALLSTIAVILQASPIYLPVVGMFISPFSTLPIVIAGLNSAALVIYVFITSILLLLMVSFQEAIIFLFTTGLIGFTMGLLLFRKKLFISIITSGISLTIGMLFLTYIIEIDGFVQLVGSLSFTIILIIYFFFSLIYSIFWNYFIKKILKYFKVNNQ